MAETLSESTRWFYAGIARALMLEEEEGGMTAEERDSKLVELGVTERDIALADKMLLREAQVLKRGRPGMSRVILSRYESGQERVVVGWDHPAGGAFWQEFREEPEDRISYPANWTEIVRDGGFWPGLPLDRLRADMPEDIRPLVTDEVMGLLAEHRRDLDSGYQKDAIDLSKKGA